MRLPKTLYVKIETPENGPSYPVCDSDIIGLIEMGNKRTIGVYRLIETQIVEGVVDVSKKQKVASIIADYVGIKAL